MAMRIYKIEVPDQVPETEVSPLFIGGMIKRMATSFFKYGAVPDAYPDRVNAIKSMEQRLLCYAKDGNMEWLIDVANFAMIEFMYPAHPKSHFRPTSSDESPGRKWHGDVDPSARGNRS